MTSTPDLDFAASIGKVWTGPDGGRWHVVFHFADIDGRTECVGVDLRTIRLEPTIGPNGKPTMAHKRDPWIGDPRPLTTIAYRALPLASLARAAREELALNAAWAARHHDKPTREALAGAAERLARGRYDADHFARVAEVYADAWRAGDSPTKAVADEFNTSRSAAAKWVAKARDLGLLGETEQRKSGGVTPTPAPKATTRKGTR